MIESGVYFLKIVFVSNVKFLTCSSIDYNVKDSYLALLSIKTFLLHLYLDFTLHNYDYFNYCEFLVINLKFVRFQYRMKNFCAQILRYFHYRLFDPYHCYSYEQLLVVNPQFTEKSGVQHLCFNCEAFSECCSLTRQSVPITSLLFNCCLLIS